MEKYIWKKKIKNQEKSFSTVAACIPSINSNFLYAQSHWNRFVISGKVSSAGFSVWDLHAATVPAACLQGVFPLDLKPRAAIWMTKYDQRGRTRQTFNFLATSLVLALHGSPPSAAPKCSTGPPNSTRKNTYCGNWSLFAHFGNWISWVMRFKFDSEPPPYFFSDVFDGWMTNKNWDEGAVGGWGWRGGGGEDSIDFLTGLSWD